MPESETAVSRRAFLEAAGVSAGLAAVRPALGTSSPRALPGGSLEDNIYTRVLGVRPHLGAHEHISRLGGGRMRPEIFQAMAEANEYFVDMHELGVAAGRRVAELIGAEAAMVTAGGFSGMILGAAACLTGSDPDKITALPHPTWTRRECLMQTAHRFDYDRAFRSAGATIVDAPTRETLMAMLGDRTAMIAGLSNAERQGVFAPPFEARRAPPPDPSLLRAEELIAIGKRAGVPVMIDMASDLPPWGSLRRFLDGGADLIVMSGGKVIGGPQSTGILAGRRDLIDAARKHASPNDNIGRGMKVGKEEVIGLVVALEGFMTRDHEAEVASWNARARRIVERLQGIPGLTVEYAVNTSGYYDADLTWDESKIALDRDGVRRALAEGTPKVELEVMITKEPAGRVWHATARTRVLRDGEELLVAARLREVFEGAKR